MTTATGIDNVYNDIFKKAICTGFYNLLARAFTTSLKLGFIPYVWKVTVLCMHIKPDKPPSQTNDCRPISLLCAIMKLFERVIEERLPKHLVSLQEIQVNQRSSFVVSLRPSWKASIEANM